MLDQILENTAAQLGNGGIVSENNDMRSINWVRGLSDPGEMIACGAYQQLRRLAGETDTDYMARLRPLLDALPPDVRAKIESGMIAAAIKRAGLATGADGKILVAMSEYGGWHDLGTVARDAMTAEQAYTMSGFDGLRYEKLPNGTFLPDGTVLPNGGFGILRTDVNPPIVIAKHVGDRYTIFSPRDMIGILEALFAADLRIETIGALDDGRALWVQARRPNEVTIAGEAHRVYYLVSQAMDGSGAIVLYVVVERVVCKNTKRLAMAGGKKVFSLRHTANAKNRMSEVREALRAADKSFDDYCAQAEKLQTAKIDAPAYYDGMLDLILDKSTAGIELTGAGLRDGSILEKIAAIQDADTKHKANLALARFEEARKPLLDQILDVHNSERGGFGAQTAWFAAQSVADVIEHSDAVTVRGEGKTRLQKRLISNDLGRADDLKQAAFTRALEASRI